MKCAPSILRERARSLKITMQCGRGKLISKQASNQNSNSLLRYVLFLIQQTSPYALLCSFFTKYFGWGCRARRQLSHCAPVSHATFAMRIVRLPSANDERVDASSAASGQDTPGRPFYRAMLCIRGTSHGPVSVQNQQLLCLHHPLCSKPRLHI